MKTIRSSLWLNTVKTPSYQELIHHEEADVAIIGAGITGITIAYLLAKQGVAVIVLDKDQVFHGETGKTTAHITNVLDDRFFRLQRLLGKKSAIMVQESHTAAINFIESTIKKEDIACDFDRLKGYLFLGPEHQRDFLEKELAALHQVGFKEARILDRVPLESFNTGPAIEIFHQAQFHPLRCLTKLLEKIEQHKGKIYGQTFVKGIRERNKKVLIDCGNGKTVTAKKVVIATNTPFINRFMIHGKQGAYRSYVIAAKIPRGYVPKALFWDTEDPYHYIRTHEEKDITYLIVGGEDHKTGQKKNTEECFKNLVSWTKKRFPELQEVAYQWSGQIIEPVDGLAYIGLNPGHPHEYIITGDSGNGITHGTIAGLLISDLILKKENPWAKLYDPARKTLGAIPELIKENANSALQYKDFVTPGELKNEKELQPGQGGILRRGVKKIALYCDTKGKKHAYSPVCPHLGGMVRWNNTEKTWDCPCHGSRFSPEGKILNGPAKKGLKPLDQKQT